MHPPHRPTAAGRRAARRTVASRAAALTGATLLLAAVGAQAAGALDLAPGGVTSPAAAKTIPIEKDVYNPAAMTIKLGETVTWTNLDAKPHTVTTTQAPAAFDSGLFAQGKSFSYTFTRPGTYGYYCAVHPDMVARVDVLGKDGRPVKAPATPVQPAPNPVTGVLAPLFPRSPAAHPGLPAPEDDPTAEHSPAGHGDNATEGAAKEAPAAAYPYRSAADPVSGAVDPFVRHLQVAHVNRGAGAQVQDIAEFDSWGKSHEALIRQMLEYEIGKDSAAGTAPVAGVFMKHMDAAHWNTSPMDQAAAISNFDSWNRSHLALIRAMGDPAVGKTSALGTARGLGVFLTHLDAAHWNTSVNGQATAITDDFPGWLSAHQALAQAMVSSLSSGTGTGTGR